MAGPSDGKKSKVSPCNRAPAGVNAADPLQVPPYFLFPASRNTHLVVMILKNYFFRMLWKNGIYSLLITLRQR